MHPIYLASGSPRRRELLTQIGVPFVTLSAAIDETPQPGEAPADYVARLALGKAQAGYGTLPQGTGAAVVLGADTAVIIDGRILGKPGDQADALEMLMSLSGREHQVLSAVALFDGSRHEVINVSAQVRFRPIEPAEAQAYWASGEPVDKAGGYAIQGLGAVFVASLTGSYSAVVGLPLCETAALLGRFGVPCWQ